MSVAVISVAPMDEPTMRSVHVETLEEIAERLGWTPQRLAEARVREQESSPVDITDRDRARAEALSRAQKRTRRELDEAS